MVDRRLWILARPRLLPFVLALVVAGHGWAHWDRALAWRGGDALARVLAAWTLLHAGTLWLNAARDRDAGAVLLGEPVPPPDGTAAVGALALLACVGVAWSTPAAPAAAICALLAVAYSHPAVAWKAHPWLGPLTNAVGYGLLTPWAGWSTVGVPPTPRTAVTGALLMIGVLGCYFLAQCFQADEDRARGDRTLAAVHGGAAAVRAAGACWTAAAAGATALALAGWWPRACLGALALVPWVAGAVQRAAREPDLPRAVEVARRLTWTAAALVALAFGSYVGESLRGGPVAGLATASGHPEPIWGTILYRLLESP